MGSELTNFSVTESTPESEAAGGAYSQPPLHDPGAGALAIQRDSAMSQRTVDITTTGRQSGRPRRIEIWFYRVDDSIYLSGSPGTRDWVGNLEAEPAFTFHLKNGIEADLPARATEVTDPDRRRAIFTTLVDDLDHYHAGDRDLEQWVASSPLFAVEFD